MLVCKLLLKWQLQTSIFTNLRKTHVFEGWTGLENTAKGNFHPGKLMRHVCSLGLQRSGSITRKTMIHWIFRTFVGIRNGSFIPIKTWMDEWSAVKVVSVLSFFLSVSGTKQSIYFFNSELNKNYNTRELNGCYLRTANCSEQWI